MIGYLVRENVSRAGARNRRFDGGKIDYVCTGVHWLANGIIECTLENFVTMGFYSTSWCHLKADFRCNTPT